MLIDSKTKLQFKQILRTSIVKVIRTKKKKHKVNTSKYVSTDASDAVCSSVYASARVSISQIFASKHFARQTDMGRYFLAKQLSEGGLFSKEPPPIEIRSPRAKQAHCQRIILFGKYEADISWHNFE